MFLVAASAALWLAGDGRWALRRSGTFAPGGASGVSA